MNPSAFRDVILDIEKNLEGAGYVVNVHLRSRMLPLQGDLRLLPSTDSRYGKFRTDIVVLDCRMGTDHEPKAVYIDVEDIVALWVNS